MSTRRETVEWIISQLKKQVAEQVQELGLTPVSFLIGEEDNGLVARITFTATRSAFMTDEEKEAQELEDQFLSILEASELTDTGDLEEDTALAKTQKQAEDALKEINDFWDNE